MRKSILLALAPPDTFSPAKISLRGLTSFQRLLPVSQVELCSPAKPYRKASFPSFDLWPPAFPSLLLTLNLNISKGFCTCMKTAEITRHKQADAGIKPPSTWAVFADIYRREGIAGINKGVNAVAVRQCTNWGSRWVNGSADFDPGLGWGSKYKGNRLKRKEVRFERDLSGSPFSSSLTRKATMSKLSNKEVC